MRVHQHTFVIVAYRESPYLEACIDSLQKQTVRSPIIISTSTPSEWLAAIAERHGLPVVVRPGESNIADDWNFALTLGETPLVTLAHQDDLYHPTYTEHVVAAADRHPDMLITFTNMDLLLDDQRIDRTVNRTIQRLLLFPYCFHGSLCSRSLRRLTLAFGNPVSCPTVTYQRTNLGRLPGGFAFDRSFPNNLDWAAWIQLAGQKGSFVYEPHILMTHRFHTGSATSASLAAQQRHADDQRIFQMMWPKPVAALLAGLYALAYRSRHG